MSDQNIGEQLAVIKHRVEKLEQWPRRVEAVEKQVQAVQNKLTTVTDALGDLKTEAHETHDVVSGLKDQINKLFYSGLAAFGTVSITWTVGWAIYKSGGFS